MKNAKAKAEHYRTMHTPKDILHFNVRMPRDLHDELEKSAKVGFRSLHSEVLMRLYQSFAKD